jgi:hypothetical protein
MTGLLPDLPMRSAAGTPDSVALRHRDTIVRYAELADTSEAAARGFCVEMS